jgi:hypothetical protein
MTQFDEQMGVSVPKKDEYDSLPDPIKMVYSRAEYLWLSDGQKATLIQTETECEYDG